MNDHFIRVPGRAAAVVLVMLLLGRAGPARSAPPPAEIPSLGENLYSLHCAMCHGKSGDGQGFAAPFLHPKPRDFRDGKYKFRTTESGSLPTDDDLRVSIAQGLHATSMPAWKNFLRGDSLNAVIAYVKSFSTRFQHEQPKEVRVGSPVPSGAKSVEAGAKVYQRLECASCHGTDGSGKDAIAADFKDDWGNDIAASNLTEPWTFRGGSTARDIFLRVRTGIDGAPMPSYTGSASDADLWNLANYVTSLGRKPLWSMDASEIKRHFEDLDAEAKANPVAHGRYLVHSRGCEACHSPYREDGQLIDSMRLAGGLKWSLGPYGTRVSPNLTSDEETGLGRWTDDEIKRAITRGIRKDGSRAIPYPMPWTSYATLTERDLNDIVAFLRTLPPVRHHIPAPQSPNVFSYLWQKFKMLILKEDFINSATSEPAGSGKESGQ